ncbi:MAG: hypothetical protein VYC41_03225 [Planctomycetota bacterium]|nr:hypothetical protein [Planctomycetota bacterium]
MLSLLLTVLAPPTPADQAFAAYLADGDHDALVSILDEVLDAAMAAVDPNALVDPKQAKKALKSNNIDVLISAAADRRLAEMLPELPEALTQRCVQELRAIPSLHHALTPLVKPGQDDLNRAFSLALDVAQEAPRAFKGRNTPAALVAAMSVVHDTAYQDRINENIAESGSLRELVPFLLSLPGRRTTMNGFLQLPPEALVHAVDLTIPASEGEWALTNYGARRGLTDLYHEVLYDWNHVLDGAPKELTRQGFSLRNVMNFGGVCADQAWFTTTVMEVRGIPAAVVVGRDATVGHAWVGWFEFAGRSARFNTDTGRYESYQKVPGLVKDPQTSGTIGEGRMGMLARFSTLDPRQRQLGRALRTVLTRVEARMNLTSEAPNADNADAVAPTTPTDRLNWIQAMLAVAPSDPGAWDIVAAASQEGAFADDTLNTLTDKLLAESSDAPDFALEVLEAMVGGLADAERAGKILERVAALLQNNRPDLAARALLAAGDAFQAAGQQDEAGKRYERIANSYANDGPWVLDAVRRVLDVLNDQNRLAARGPAYVESIFNRVKKPEFMSSEWARQSNWYQLGMLLSETLARTGRPGQGADVMRRLDGMLDRVGGVLERESNR